MPAAQPKKAPQLDLYKYLGILWRRKWLLIIPMGVCVPVAMLAAYWHPIEYESRAVLEIQDSRPIGDRGPGPIHGINPVMGLRTRAMSWSAVREIVLSRRVDFGREIDPDDRRQLERIYSEVERRTRIMSLSPQHLAIAHRSTSPERNASLINEIVKKFVGEDRRESQERAKADLKYYRDKLAASKTSLAEIDNQIREFNQQYPWLTDTLAEIQRSYEDAEADELLIRQQIKTHEETIAELRKELAKEKSEVFRTVRPEVPPEIIELRRAADQAKRYYEQVSGRYTRAHPRHQEAEAVLRKALAELKAKDTGDPAEEKVAEPNPKYAAMQTRITALERELERLNARKLDANKQVSEKYIRRRKAPELLGERRALEEQRIAAASTASEYDAGVRVAEKEMARLLSEAHSARFRVLEYARDDRRPVKSTQMKIITLGIVMGLFIGAGLIGLLEYLDQTFKSIDDVRDYLGLPALGVIPAIFTPRDHRRKLLFRVLAISSAVFVVGVAVAIYLTVPGTKEVLNVGWLRFQEWLEYW